MGAQTFTCHCMYVSFFFIKKQSFTRQNIYTQVKHSLKIYINRYRYSNPYVRAVFVVKSFHLYRSHDCKASQELILWLILVLEKKKKKEV